MPLEIPETFREYGGMVGRGVVTFLAPQIGKGILVRILKDEEVDTKKVTEWVLTNTRLWDVLKLSYGERLKMVAEGSENMDWMTFDWVIDAIRHDFPAVASLFLGWTKGKNWLTRQVEILKREIQG